MSMTPLPIQPISKLARSMSMSLFNRKGMKTFEAGPNAVPVQMQAPLKGVAPGRYICQISVIDEIGRKFAFPRAALIVQ